MGFADRFSKKGPGNTSDNKTDTDDSNTSSSEESSDTASTTTSGSSGSNFLNKYAAGRSGGIPSGTEKKEATSSFTDNVQKKTQPQSYTDKVTRRGDLVYLVHGKDRDRDAWHYVLVDKNKLPLFLKQIETGSIDVALYGEVLRSGWGKNPPPEIVKEIEDEFGN